MQTGGRESTNRQTDTLMWDHVPYLIVVAHRQTCYQKTDRTPTLFDCGGTAGAGIQTSGTQTGALAINQSDKAVVVTLLGETTTIPLCNTHTHKNTPHRFRRVK